MNLIGSNCLAKHMQLRQRPSIGYNPFSEGGDSELLEERSSESRSVTKFTRNRPQRLLGKVFGFNQYMKGPRQPCAERNLR
jgi:hypothetical protein